MDDVLDILTDDGQVVADDEPLSDPSLFVCDAIEDGAICGATFDSNAKLNGHKQGKHRDRSRDAKRGEGGKKPADKKPTQTKKPVTETRRQVEAAPINRTATYASSIALAGLGCYMAIPGFDDYDLDVVNKGSHSLAAALDAVGEVNPTVRTACDLALGGGTGGAYVQLVMACLSVGTPIAAHHGWLPASAGERFGMIIGVMPPVAPSPSVPSTHPDNADGDGAPSEVIVVDPHTMTDDDWMNLIIGIPPHVFANLAGRLMGQEGSIGVPIPGTADNGVYDIPDDRIPAFAVPTPEGNSSGTEG